MYSLDILEDRFFLIQPLQVETCQFFAESILNNHNEIIGVIAHDNLSVPTSIYMFASFRIPVIVLDINPLNSLVKEFGIGEVVKSQNDVNLSIMKIKKNYKSYQIKCKEFISINSWDNSIDIHKSVFK